MIETYFSQHYYILLIFLLCMGFLAGFIDAIAGGGGLISLPALVYTGLPIATVLGTNKLQASLGTSIAVYHYYRGGLIDILTVYRGLVMGFIGAVLGAVVVNYASNHFMQYVVPFLMLAVFLFSLFNKHLGIHAGKKRINEITFFAVFGFIFGFYDGFFGPGTGNFWIITIVFFLGYTFLHASGYAKVLNLKSNLISLSVFLFYGKVNFIFAAIMGLGNISGSYLGAKIVILKGSRLVRPFFMLIVLVNVVMSFYELIFSPQKVVTG